MTVDWTEAGEGVDAKEQRLCFCEPNLLTLASLQVERVREVGNGIAVERPQTLPHMLTLYGYEVGLPLLLQTCDVASISQGIQCYQT